MQREAIQVSEFPFVFQRQNVRPQNIRLQSVPEHDNQSNFPPREAALLRESFGLTNEDLMNIQRLAQERIEQELKSLTQEDLNSDTNTTENDDEDNSGENIMNMRQSNSQQQPDQLKVGDPKREIPYFFYRLSSPGNRFTFLLNKF